MRTWFACGGRAPVFKAAPLLAVLLAAGSGAAADAQPTAAPSMSLAPAAAAFDAENKQAMDRMMVDMDVKPSGDIDRDFVAMMRPHHQGAIDMAQAYLRHGHDEALRRIAQEIIVEQQQEIAAMNLAVGAPLPASAPAPTQGTPTQGARTQGAPQAAPAAGAAGARRHHHDANR